MNDLLLKATAASMLVVTVVLTASIVLGAALAWVYIFKYYWS